jgi:hypothetical protein
VDDAVPITVSACDHFRSLVEDGRLEGAGRLIREWRMAKPGNGRNKSTEIAIDFPR